MSGGFIRFTSQSARVTRASRASERPFQPSWTDEDALADRLTAIDDATDVAVLDFDETLWLRNSTEAFLASARPYVLVAVVLQILGQIKPWRLLSRSNPEHYRDWIRIAAVLIVAPWSYFTWRRTAARIGPAYANRPLMRALGQVRPGRIVVATYGFRFIVAPLLKAIDPDYALVAAASLRRGAALRRIGKGRAVADAIGADTLSRGVAVTDSGIDRDLCVLCRDAFYVRWRDAEYRQAGLTPMLPLAYTARVKRPTERYVLHGIIGYDFAVLWLAYALMSPALFTTTAALGLYLLAFFAVYEIGYYDNDRVGLARESAPVVSPQFTELGHHFRPRWAWAFGLILAGLGACMQSWGDPAAVTKAGPLSGWALVGWRWAMAAVLLGVTRLTFLWFNALSPKLRIVPMLVLQVERTLGYALLFAIDTAGAILCVAHAIGRWVPYVIYRFGGQRADFPAHIATFIVFLMFFPIAILTDRQPVTEALTIEFYVIALYLAVRAAKDLHSFRRKTAAVVA
ncbi:MAG: hypothetical protein DI547_14840 [Sphingobium sp.]|nr:MAG: hypothetical protein DI547_14840 [Sphingobium sp.]